MSAPRNSLVFAAAVFSAAMLFEASAGRSRPAMTGVSQQQPEQKPANVKEIPLASIYFTFPQKGTKHMIPPELPEKYQFTAKALFRSATDIGASNIFMVYGDKFEDALQSTFSVFCMRAPVNKPAPDKWPTNSKSFWVVAFFGVNGSHGEWLLKTVTVEGNKIRVSYHDGRKGGAVLLDLLPYFAWVPLGNLEPGCYILELFDEDHKQLCLMRRVTVPGGK